MTPVGWAAFAVGLVGYTLYAADIIRRKARPDRPAWVIWTVQYGVMTGALAAHGLTFVVWLAGVQWLGVVVITALAFWRGSGDFTHSAAVTLVLIAAGLGMWWLFQESLAALVLCLAIETAGIVRVIIAVVRDPSTETYLMWACAGLSGALGVGELVQQGSAGINYVYPAALAVINIAVVVAKGLCGSRRRETLDFA